MGNTLSAAAQWTTAKENAVGKLEFTPVNELILNRIAEFTMNFSERYPKESLIIFKKPLTWKTNMDITDFESAEGYVASTSGIISSLEMDLHGRPLLVFKMSEDGSEMKVSNFFHLGNVLVLATEQLAEVRACLEANRDPLTFILGDRFVSDFGYDDTVTRLIDQVIAGEDSDLEDKKLLLRLLLLLKEFDEHLMNEAVKTISNEVKLTPTEVNRIFDLLVKISGSDADTCVLLSITWTQPFTFVFKNGCRAPFWRQIHGDISYITAEPHDKEAIYITASTNGYFINKGPADKGEHDFERTGEVYRDLVELLRDESPIFDSLIDEQKIFEMWQAEEEVEEVMDSKDSVQDVPKSALTLTQKVITDDAVGKKAITSEETTQQKQKKKMKPTAPRMIKIRKQKPKSTRILKKQKRRKVKLSKLEKWLAESSSSEIEDGDGPYDKVNYDMKATTMEQSGDHWIIQRLLKFIKGGNPSATLIGLCQLRDLDLFEDSVSYSVRECGGIEVLVNLLEASNISCMIGSLKVLNMISASRFIRQVSIELGIIQVLIDLLKHVIPEVVGLAADVLGHIAKTSSARRIMRSEEGLRRLVALIDIPSSFSSFLDQEGQKLSVQLAARCSGDGEMEDLIREQWENKLFVAQCAARALAGCANSKRNRTLIRMEGAFPLLARQLGSSDVSLLIPIVGIVKEFAKESAYCVSIRSEHMVADLVRTFRMEDLALQENAAWAIYRASNDEVIRDQIRNFDGLEPLVSQLNSKTSLKILLPVTGAIWKLCLSSENVESLQKLNIINLLSPFLDNQSTQVVISVVGAYAEIMKVRANRMTFLRSGGLGRLLMLQTSTTPKLLVNVNNTVAECANEPECNAFIVQKDGVLLLWSCLKNKCPEVQASASWALCPCVRIAKDSAELVRSFLGGLEFLVKLLQSSHVDVLAATCAAIATVAEDEENLAVMSDNSVVLLLSKLACTNDEKLQEHVAEAIAMCCTYANNRQAFGQEDAVIPLIKYLKGKSPKVHRTTAMALHQLSKYPDNCITMHSHGVVPLLVNIVGSRDKVTQECAAGCLYNIRRLALANEIAHDIIFEEDTT